MDIVFLIIFMFYLYAGAKANSFIKHNIFHLQTALIFDLRRFVIDKIIMSLFLGWISIPLALILYVIGVGRQR